MDILSDLRDRSPDQRLVVDLNYCLKQISSGKLYESTVDLHNESTGERGLAHKEVL